MAPDLDLDATASESWKRATEAIRQTSNSRDDATISL
jgi:hypothetical protein